MVFSPEVQKEINDLLVMVISGISAGLLIVVPIVGKMAWSIFRAWANAKLASIQNKEMREALEFALQRLDKTAETVVSEIEQTTKRDEQGKVIDPIGAQRSAINAIHSRIEPNSRALLEKLYGKNELARIYKGKVESKVKIIPRC